MAGPTRLELATSCVTGRRSNRLNYGPAGKILDWWAVSDLNGRPSGCKPDALTAELTARVCHYLIQLQLTRLLSFRQIRPSRERENNIPAGAQMIFPPISVVHANTQRWKQCEDFPLGVAIVRGKLQRPSDARTVSTMGTEHNIIVKININSPRSMAYSLA